MPSSPKKRPVARAIRNAIARETKATTPTPTEYLKDYGRFAVDYPGNVAKTSKSVARGAGKAVAKGAGKGASAVNKAVTGAVKSVAGGATKGYGKTVTGLAEAAIKKAAPKKAAPKATRAKPIPKGALALNKPITKQAKSVGGVYLADGTEYKGKNGKPSGIGTVAPRRPGKSVGKPMYALNKTIKKVVPKPAAVDAARKKAAKSVAEGAGKGAAALNKAMTKKAVPTAKAASGISKSMKKPIPKTTQSSGNPNRPSTRKPIPKTTRVSHDKFPYKPLPKTTRSSNKSMKNSMPPPQW